MKEVEEVDDEENTLFSFFFLCLFLSFSLSHARTESRTGSLSHTGGCWVVGREERDEVLQTASEAQIAYHWDARGLQTRLI